MRQGQGKKMGKKGESIDKGGERQSKSMRGKEKGTERSTARSGTTALPGGRCVKRLDRDGRCGHSWMLPQSIDLIPQPALYIHVDLDVHTEECE